MRAAEFWLYFPNQKLQLGLQPYRVPEMYFFYPAPEEVNYRVPIDDVMDLKLRSAVVQVSQFSPSEDRYREDWDPKDLKATEEELIKLQPRKDSHVVEEYRYSTGFNQE